MKKAYVTPTVEKVEFQYDKVVVASGMNCTKHWVKNGDNGCPPKEQYWDGTWTVDPR